MSPMADSPLQAKMDREIQTREELSEKLEKEIQSRKALEEQINGLQKEHRAEVARLKADHHEDISRLKRDHQDQISDLRDRHRRDVAWLEDQIDTLKARLSQQDEVIRRLQETIHDLSAEAQEQATRIKGLETDMRDMRQQHQADIQSVLQTFRAEQEAEINACHIISKVLNAVARRVSIKTKSDPQFRTWANLHELRAEYEDNNQDALAEELLVHAKVCRGREKSMSEGGRGENAMPASHTVC